MRNQKYFVIQQDNQYLNQINEKLDKMDHIVVSIESAKQFLSSFDLQKSNIDRMIAWLLLFDAISLDKSDWGISLQNIITRYEEIINCHDNYIRNLFESKNSKNIQKEISRNEGICNEIMKFINVKHQKYQQREINDSLARFITVSLHHNPIVDYVQGIDRVAFISFSLSLKFSNELGFDLKVAEAFASVLLRSSLPFLDSYFSLASNYSVNEYFEDLEIYLSSLFPLKVKLLNDASFPLFPITSNWIGTAFVDNHDVGCCLRIWDELVLHQKEIKNFIRPLIAAHLDQVSFEGSPADVYIELQQKNDWDVNQIIEKANELHNPKKIDRFFFTKFFSFWL